MSIRLRNFLSVFCGYFFTKRWIEPYYVSLSLVASPWIIIIIITVNVIIISSNSSSIIVIIISITIVISINLSRGYLSRE